ncbi:MAG: 50S ribosomal protein L24 [Planctomycetes bacterium]|jgi:large subunit ribosomal protein L24|nr:50S ribosomal protein L24 [Planctomycetota bacterium]
MASKVKLPKPEKQLKCHVRTGDKVIVLSGDNKGKTGTVIKVFPQDQRALVEGDAAVYDTKHVKANPQAGVEGGRVQRLRPLHVSKLALLDPTTNKPARVRHERGENGVVRVAKKSGHKFTANR